MFPITIKNLDEQTTNWLDREACKRDIPPDELVSDLLREVVLTKQGELQDLAHHGLNHLAGTWSDEELIEFVTATAGFEKIDTSLW